MSDLDFDLDIKNYTNKELEELLGVTFPYTPDEIHTNIVHLKNRILKDTQLEEKKKKEIVTFLRNVNEKLNKLLSQKKEDITQNTIAQYGAHFIIDRNSHAGKVIENGSIKLNPHRKDYGAGNSSLLEGWSSGTITRILSFDSKFRKNYFTTTSTDFKIELPVTVKKVVTMELVALEIPATYFSVSKKLGTNYFHLAKNNGADLTKITLPDGNYTRSEMQNELNLMFVAAGFGATQASIDEKTNRTIIDLNNDLKEIYFNLTENATAITDIDNTPIQMKLGWMLGFRQAIYVNTGADNSIYVSEGVYDAWGAKYFYFVINDYKKNNVKNIDAILNSSVVSSDILARLSRGAFNGIGFGSGFVYDASSSLANNSSKTREYFGPVDIQKLHIQIIDSYGRVADLNNMDISFALQFKCLYD